MLRLAGNLVIFLKNFEETRVNADVIFPVDEVDKR